MIKTDSRHGMEKACSEDISPNGLDEYADNPNYTSAMDGVRGVYANIREKKMNIFCPPLGQFNLQGRCCLHMTIGTRVASQSLARVPQEANHKRRNTDQNLIAYNHIRSPYDEMAISNILSFSLGIFCRPWTTWLYNIYLPALL